MAAHEPATTTMTVGLPAAMKEWIDAQVRAGLYGDAGAYLQALIRRDQERAAASIVIQHLAADSPSDPARRQVRGDPGDATTGPR